jgi:predicted NBD/HSP70 family sugar kinase
MNYLAYDVGGSSVKYALVDEQGNLQNKGSFPTPAALEDFYAEVVKVCQQLGKGRELAGAGFSMPGAVDDESGVIGGSSALDYIHDFPIKQALAARLGMPVALENDANCAALGEAWTGAGQEYSSLAYFVVGTGVGGAVVADKKIIHGPHQHGGEFGYMVMNDDYEILSEVGSTGGLCRQLARLRNVPEDTYDGRKVYELSEQGDADAARLIDNMYEYLARAVYNIQYTYDPEAILFGGAISSRPDFIPAINERIQKILEKVGVARVVPKLLPCQHGNDANLLGAVANLRN